MNTLRFIRLPFIPCPGSPLNPTPHPRSIYPDPDLARLLVHHYGGNPDFWAYHNRFIDRWLAILGQIRCCSIPSLIVPQDPISGPAWALGIWYAVCNRLYQNPPQWQGYWDFAILDGEGLFWVLLRETLHRDYHSQALGAAGNLRSAVFENLLAQAQASPDPRVQQWLQAWQQGGWPIP